MERSCTITRFGKITYSFAFGLNADDDYEFDDMPHMGSPIKDVRKKVPVFRPPTIFVHNRLTPSPLRTSASSIRHCSVVWLCNSWSSQNMLLIKKYHHNIQFTAKTKAI